MAARHVRWVLVLGTILVTLGAGAALHLIHAGRAAGQTSGRPQPTQDPDPLAPFPMPPELVGVDLLGQIGRGRGRARAPAASPATRTSATRTSRTRSASAAPTATAATPIRTDKEQAHVRAAVPAVLADVRQPGALVHAAEPRVAGVHPLRQPRRLPRSPTSRCGTAGCHPKEVQIEPQVRS